MITQQQQHKQTVLLSERKEVTQTQRALLNLNSAQMLTVTTRLSPTILQKGSATCRKMRLDERSDEELGKENIKLSARAGRAVLIRAVWKTIPLQYKVQTHTENTGELGCFGLEEMRNRAVTHTCAHR